MRNRLEIKYRKALKDINREKKCFYGDGNCSDNMIKSHSIQNNKILSKLSENGEVIYFDFETNEKSLQNKFVRMGRKIATTFWGFCGWHDNNLFLPIEENNYQVGNKEQEFLFAYRALAQEYK